MAGTSNIQIHHVLKRIVANHERQQLFLAHLHDGG